MARRNITLSAEESLIQRARIKALHEKKSLNAVFQEWLEQYTRNQSSAINYKNLMKKLSHIHAGKRFTRDELNER